MLVSDSLFVIANTLSTIENFHIYHLFTYKNKLVITTIFLNYHILDCRSYFYLFKTLIGYVIALCCHKML